MVIENYGHVPLPLNALSADGLIKMSKPSNANKCGYEIAPSEISFENPVWEEKLKLLVKRVMAGMGCNGYWDSELVCARVYTKGDSHRNEPKPEVHKHCKNILKKFATLTLQLPSVREGMPALDSLF